MKLWKLFLLAVLVSLILPYNLVEVLILFGIGYLTAKGIGVIE